MGRPFAGEPDGSRRLRFGLETYMAARIAETVGIASGADVLAALLPDAGERGWIDVLDPELSPRQAAAVLAWAERGDIT